MFFGPMWKGVINPSKKSLTRLKLVRPILQEPSTKNMMSAAASVLHSKGFLGKAPKKKKTTPQNLTWRNTFFQEVHARMSICHIIESTTFCYAPWHLYSFRRPWKGTANGPNMHQHDAWMNIRLNACFLELRDEWRHVPCGRTTWLFIIFSCSINTVIMSTHILFSSPFSLKPMTSQQPSLN